MSRPAGAAAGIVADRLLGEPPLGSAHPVALLGRSLGAIERRTYAPTRWRGAVHAIAGATVGTVAGAAVRSTALATYVTVAGRALGDAALEVRDALRSGDLDRARELLPSLVGRDPSGLDEKEISRAVVESVAENTVDAVVAPALWAAIFGPGGAGFQRTVDTMDSMVGHLGTRYRDYGWTSARLDDAVEWIPARVTAGLVALCRPRSAGAVLRAVRRDAGAHPSPNAGVVEAAFAAALGLRLGGTNRYGERVDVRPPLGDGRPPEIADIAAAVRLSRDTGLAWAGVLAAVAATSIVRRREHR